MRQKDHGVQLFISTRLSLAGGFPLAEDGGVWRLGAKDAAIAAARAILLNMSPFAIELVMPSLIAGGVWHHGGTTPPDQYC